MSNPFVPAQQAPVTQSPQGNPFIQQQTPVVQQQQAYQPVQAAPPATGLVARPGGFSTPPPPSAGGSGGPRIADLQGRLLLILPESVQRQIPSKFTNNGQTVMQDKVTATVIVLDGGPLQWTPKVSGQLQQPRQENVPYVIKGMWIQQSKLIEQLEEALAMRLRGEPGLTLGRLWKAGTATNDAYVLAAPQPQDAATYDQYVAQVNPFTL